jgi:hypothetical protein
VELRVLINQRGPERTLNSLRDGAIGHSVSLCDTFIETPEMFEYWVVVSSEFFGNLEDLFSGEFGVDFWGLFGFVVVIQAAHCEGAG